MKPDVVGGVAAVDNVHQPALSGFRIIRRLGQGAMGEVFEAIDTALDRKVAIKFLAASHNHSAGANANQRLIIEAKAIARLQHPHIVVIYQAAYDRVRPYIVSELVTGGSLDLCKSPLPWPVALRMAQQLCQALVAAHGAGVLHRDIKPANILVDSDQNVKLCDFGLAKLNPVDAMHNGHAETASSAIDSAAIAQRDWRAADIDATISLAANTPAVQSSDALRLTDPGTLIGTPLYMSPEQWCGQSCDERSDLYSLGVVCFELITGRTPFEGHSFNALRRHVLTEPAPLLASLVDPEARGFAAAIDRCLRIEAHHRPASASELLEALNQAHLAVTNSLTDGNPYRGLQSFAATHRGFFFGRRQAIDDVLTMLRHRSWVVVTGDSGAGKSSLCHAGIVPAMVDTVADELRVVAFHPGRRPMDALLQALAPDSPSIVTQRGRPHVLVVIDQLEELVTLSDAQQAEQLLQLLAQWTTSPTVRVQVLASARGDFLGRLAALPLLSDELSTSLYLVRPMSAPSVRSAVIEPARMMGFEFETAAIVDELAEFALNAHSGLPLLQFALAELWNARDKVRRLIPDSALANIGGTAGALTRHADGIYDRLVPVQQRAVRALVIRLATAQRTRTRCTEQELCENSEDARSALRALVAGRLVVSTTSDENSAAEFTLAHEVLLERWQRLEKWLASDSDQELWLQRLSVATKEWMQSGQLREQLWPVSKLTAYQAVVTSSALRASDQLAFLSTSQRFHRRETIKRWALWVGVPLLLLASYAVFAINNRVQRDRRVAAHQQAASLHITTGEGHRQQASRSEALAFEQFDAKRGVEAEVTYSAALAQNVIARRSYSDASQELESSLLLDPDNQLIRNSLADVLFDRALLAETARESAQLEDILTRLQLIDSSGQRMQRWKAPARLTLQTDVPAHAEVQQYGRNGFTRTLDAKRSLGATPIRNLGLAPGSYVFTFTSAGRAPVLLPVQVGRNEEFVATIEIPTLIPAHFRYVPAGRSLYGSVDSEEARRNHLLAQPQHSVTTASYFIDRYEVTIGDYLRFLDTLPADEQQQRRPQLKGDRGTVNVVRISDMAQWRIELAPTEYLYQATASQLIKYLDRSPPHAGVDWRQLPVSAIVLEDAQAYLQWLDRTGAVPGARLCTEHEWERAARGADDRLFPAGDVLEPSSANFDETYGRSPRAFGPDGVGSHPASDSPFGVSDLAGNVWEWTTSSASDNEVTYRGGSWYESRMNARSNNRQVGELSQRDLVIGVRVCASLHPSKTAKGTSP